MPDEFVYPNGVSGLTGGYLLDPVAPAVFAARMSEVDGDVADELHQLWDAINEPSFGLPFHLHADVVTEVGWAIVFSTEEDPEVRAAMQPLIEHRRRQIGEAATKVLDHRPGEGWRDWLARQRTSPGNIDPEKLPYYVLLVGSPSNIPFRFQYLLDVEYAVGRLHFDEPGGYRRYTSALIKREVGAAEPREAAATFFGTRHPFDAATRLSADLLVSPLAQSFQPGGALASAIPGYRIDCLLGDRATKTALGEVFTGAGPSGRPGVIFSATHGMGGWPVGHPDQMAKHGALLCQDWPAIGQISSQHYFAAVDLASDADVAGVVAFFFACYGAGTPQVDSFAHRPGESPPTIATHPFVAGLPKALLEAGALAVVGHVERAWGYSFVSAGRAQLLPFQNAIGLVMSHAPVGHAMKDFNEKYAALSANISDVLESMGFGKVISDSVLARLWTERNDARNYVLLGDPAATLQTA